MTVEQHPLQPFLPTNAKILFLGSFPPPRARWNMIFFYPNWINDFWRIMGLIHFGNKTEFEVPGEKRFDKDRIVHFAESEGLAFYDTATKVKRLNDNASDDLLEVLEATDITKLLQSIPQCQTLVTTGGKASTLVQEHFHLSQSPKVGDSIDIQLSDRTIRWWRMPSRAYPLAIDKKAAFYHRLWE